MESFSTRVLTGCLRFDATKWSERTPAFFWFAAVELVLRADFDGAVGFFHGEKIDAMGVLEGDLSSREAVSALLTQLHTPR